MAHFSFQFFLDIPVCFLVLDWERYTCNTPQILSVVHAVNALVQLTKILVSLIHMCVMVFKNDTPRSFSVIHFFFMSFVVSVFFERQSLFRWTFSWDCDVTVMQRNCMVKIGRGSINIIVLSCVIKVFEKTWVAFSFYLKSGIT